MSSLRSAAVSGAAWSFAGKILQHGVQFIFGVILARLLLPEQYGLIAMAMVFITVFYVFVNSGFGVAIVQRKNIDQKDLSTVFYMNMGISLLSYGVLYLTAPFIAKFYNQPELIEIIRVLSLLIILFALSIVQNSLITRDVKFKLRARIELVAQILSGIIAIYLAYTGWGVWALVWKTLLNQVFVNIQLWIQNNWFPALIFSKKSFKTLFSFSSKMLASGLLDTIYNQLNRLVVGKFFPAAELGYYTRAEQFKNLPTQIATSSLLSFLLPIFSKIQDQPERMKNAAKRIMKISMFFNVLALIMMGILAFPIIEVLLGDKWIETVPYLQLLVFVGIFYPMHAINVQILVALGRSDLFLRIEIIKKLMGIPPILLAIFISIKAMIAGMIVVSLLALLVNTYHTRKLINLGIVEQLSAIRNSLIIGVAIAIIFTPIVYYLNHVNQLLILVTIGILMPLCIYGLLRIFKLDEYREMKSIFDDIKTKYAKR